MPYFCVIFSHLAWPGLACLFLIEIVYFLLNIVFNRKKVYFWPFHAKSEINKPEGNANVKYFCLLLLLLWLNRIIEGQQQRH